MARRADEIEDRTPLAGARIDVAARIGWLLRTSRTAAGVRMREFGERAGTGSHLSPATLSRVETAGRRSGTVIDAYERALELPYGHLRAPIDVLSRTFSYAPEDVEPYRPDATLAGFSGSCAAVQDDPAGADWLRFAEYHTHTPFGLPEPDVRPLIERLVNELGRSAGAGYQLRYEALAKLRCSAYGDIVAGVIREAVLAPGMQRAYDLMSAVTELPSPALVQWCGELLSHDSWQIARASCLGIQNMRSVGGLRARDWGPLVAPFAAACVAAVDDPRRGPILSATLASCPPDFRREVRAAVGFDLPPPRKAAAWTHSRRNRHFAHAARMAAAIAGTSASNSAGEGAGEGVLTRLLFEVLYDFRATHVVTSGFLLVASPFSDGVREQLCSAALDGPDETTRHGAAYAFANLMVPFEVADPAPWLASPDPAIRAAGLSICGFAGVPLPPATLQGLVGADDELCRDALFAAGMASQPELAQVATSHADPAIRDAAQWWIDHGGRVSR